MAEQPPDAAVDQHEESSTAEAVETAVEGVPSALSLAPATIVPALGGELVVAEEQPTAPVAEAVVSGDSVRAGLRQAGPLALAGLVANGANVVVTIVMARLLAKGQYGALAQLTGVFLVVSMPGSAVITGVVRRVTAWKGQGSAVRVWRWARRLHVQGTVGLMAFLVLAVVVRSWLAHELSLPDAVGIVGILGAGGLWVLLSLDRGLMQAHRNYRSLSINLLVEGGVRSVAMLVLVGAGFGVAGAAWGMFIGELVTAIHARVVADRAWSGEARRELAATGGDEHPGKRSLDAVRQVVESVERREMVVDLVAALAAMALLALLQNIDVIVLGREAPHHSGAYAAISVSSKALVFGALALGGYLLPEAAIRWRQGGHAIRQLTVTLLLLAAPVLVLLLVAMAAPRLFLTEIFGKRYVGANGAFIWLALAMVFLSITVVLTMYLLAIGRREIALLLAVGAVAATVAVALAHGSPRATAVADLGVQVLLAGVTVAVFAVVHKRRLTILA